MATTLPKKYTYLAREGAPKMLVAALAKFGTREIVGPQHSPEIMAWARHLNMKADYTADETPWCGLFMAVCAVEAGWQVPRIPLRARQWLTFGNPAPVPMLGDVLVFGRNGGGHVGLYVGETNSHFAVLGGNQGNAVAISMFPKKSASFPFLGARRAAWRSLQPPNVRRIPLSETGPAETVTVV